MSFTCSDPDGTPSDAPCESYGCLACDPDGFDLYQCSRCDVTTRVLRPPETREENDPGYPDRYNEWYSRSRHNRVCPSCLRRLTSDDLIN